MSPTPPLFAVGYRLAEPPPGGLRVGEAMILQVELTNAGASPWLTSGAYPTNLAYRWRDAAGNVVADGLRAPLPAPVPPGMGLSVELRVESPPAPGDYRLDIELVEEGVAWFSDRGVAPLSLGVSFAPADAPRVCIINGNVVANDAVGGHIVAQLLALRAAGYHTLLITGFVDSRLPADVRRSMATANRQELHSPIPRTRAAAEHFHSADIVIVNYSIYYDLVEVIRDVRRAVVIFDYHGVTPPELWGRQWPGYDDLVKGRDNLSLVRFADYGIGHSQFTCGELVATGLIPEGRVALMPYAVVKDAGYAGAPDPAVVERFGLAGKRVLLYVGRMARNKRVHDLVEALPAIHARYPETVLLLVGETRLPAYRGYVEEISARAAELGVAASVIFTGQVDDETLESCYRACDAFVTASIHEGFCMPVVEAMARGRPVVAADTTALPGTMAGAGLLFRPEDPAHLAEQVCALLADMPPPGDRDDPLAVHRVPPADEAELAALRGRPIAFVTPRYGPQILGGAESGLRSWAEQLAARGYRVEALTTATINMGDWSDHLAPGVEEINGVTVRRFSADRVDAGVFHTLQHKASQGVRLRYDEEQRFVANNLRSADLERHVAQHADTYAAFILAPYLFGTTYWPAVIAPDRAIVVPCLHDEAAARLAVFREMMEGAAALFFNADAESAFASEALGVANLYRERLGFGFEDDYPVGDGEGFRAERGLEGPILLYTGRLERAKNVPLLIAYFERYKAERPGPLTLALTGTGDVPLPQRPDVVGLGMLDRGALTDAYAAATLLCQPSLNESFSIVLMESWLQGRPVLVHAECAVTSDHVAQSGGGYAFAGYESFRDALDRILADEGHAAGLGELGRRYVRERYAWGSLLPRIESAIAAYSRPRPLYATLARRGVRRALAFTRHRFEDALLALVERAWADLPAELRSARRDRLAATAMVSRPGYAVRSGLPVVGRLVAWARRQLTAHLKEPYLDPVIADQERFNRDLLDTLLPALEESLREQRRLRAEVEVLRERLGQEPREGEG